MAAKGVTIVIALIIATAIMLATAASAFFFFQKVQVQTQGQTESAQSALLARFATCIKLVSFKFNPVDNTSQAVIRNCGFREIELSDNNLIFIIKMPSGESCTFSLNSSNCATCIGKVGVGSFATLNINASAIPCSSTLADLLHKAIGQSVEIILSDKVASFTTAQTFVPEPLIICQIDLNRTPLIVNASACYNYTITNFGNAPDAFTIYIPQYFFPGSPTIQGFIGNGCIGTPRELLELETIKVNQSTNFSVFVDLEGGGSSCPNLSFAFNITARSSNCADVFKRDLINQTC